MWPARWPRRIDPRPFEVEVQSTEAALARAKAVLEQASQHAQRIATLTSQRAAPEAKNASYWRRAGRVAKNVALFFAAPFVGLAYIVVFPFVGIAMLAWIGGRALLTHRKVD